MMARRLNLHKEFKNLGFKNVYFQPPENVKLKFPALIYKLNRMDISHANDRPYAIRDRYNVLYITKTPDDEMVEKLAWAFSTITNNTNYISDTLYHYSFDLYY